MTDNKVVGIRGDPVDPCFDPGVLSIVEDIYAKAKGGKVSGIAVTLMVEDDEPGFRVTASYFGPKISLLGAVIRLEHKIQKDIDIQSEQEQSNGPKTS